MKRRIFIKNASLAGVMAIISPLLANVTTPCRNDFPIIDLHIYTTGEFTIEQAMEIIKEFICLIPMLKIPKIS